MTFNPGPGVIKEVCGVVKLTLNSIALMTSKHDFPQKSIQMIFDQKSSIEAKLNVSDFRRSETNHREVQQSRKAGHLRHATFRIDGHATSLQPRGNFRHRQRRPRRFGLPDALQRDRHRLLPHRQPPHDGQDRQGGRVLLRQRKVLPGTFNFGN